MKLTKMSLVAALLVAGTSAFAIDNVKVSGDAKLYYSTSDYESKDNNGAIQDQTDIFNRNGAAAQVAFDLGITADLVKNVSTGIKFTVTDTLGLENNLVSGTWSGPIAWDDLGTNDAAGAATTQYWVSEAWVAATAGKTTGKIGRMELDTPLAFSEKWNIVENTFGAVVVLNQDIPDTTLVGAYVGQSNGSGSAGGFATVASAGPGDSPFTGYTTYNNALTALGFDKAGGSGAYAAGVVNNSWKPLTVQGWYYNVVEVADAFWLQADLNYDGVLFGAQYTEMDPKSTIRLDNGTGFTPTDVSSLNLKTSKAYALLLGYEMKNVGTLKVSYSSTDDEGALTIQNTATGSQTKLYTEAWWNYGIVGLSGTDAITVYAEGNVADIVDVFAQYTNAKVQPKGMQEDELNEFTLGATKSFGALDAQLAYIYADMSTAANNSWVRKTEAAGYTEKDTTSHTIQAYLTLNF